jgi:hypothetical protein
LGYVYVTNIIIRNTKYPWYQIPVAIRYDAILHGL